MPGIESLNYLDYLVVFLYGTLIIIAGWIVSRFNERTSDYFKGGGRIPWGLSAVSLFISGFSAFMFVGAAGFTYRNGTSAIILFSLAAPAYLLGYFLYGQLWRRTRIDTPLEFLTRRFSPGTTYFYTIISVVPNVLILGIYIYTLCLFISTAFGFHSMSIGVGGIVLTGIQVCMLITGSILVIYTLLGGLWAVMVTDALQFIVLFVATLTMVPVAYLFLGDGNSIDGISRLIHEAPEGYLGFNLQDRPSLFWVAYLINTVLGYNVNWHIAQRYYSVPDERDTKKMALWCAGLSLVLPLFWILPVLASKVLYPDLASMWPELAEPTEAAFVTLALDVLPHGMMGVVVAAMFAATMSSADTLLNWLSAVITKDAYVPLSQRLGWGLPSEKAQLRVGRLCVALMGIISILIAFNMEKLGGVFDVHTKATSLYSAPMFIPVLLGLVFTRSPWWSGMISFGGGVVAIIAVSLYANILHGLPANSFNALFLDINLSVLGLEVTRYELQMLVGTGASMACFFASMLLNKRKGTYKVRIEHLEKDLRTPAWSAVNEKLDQRGMTAYRLTARLTLIVGGILILAVIPTLNDPSWPINAIGGTIALLIGSCHYKIYKQPETRYPKTRNCKTHYVLQVPIIHTHPIRQQPKSGLHQLRWTPPVGYIRIAVVFVEWSFVYR